MLNALTMLAAMTSPVQTDAPSAPLGKWQVNWGETNCLAMQHYGDAKAPTTFALKPSLNGDVIRLMITRKGPYQNAAHFPVTLGDVKTTALGFRPAKTAHEMFWINLSRGDFDRLAALPTFTIKGRRLDLVLSTSGFASAARALDTCNKNLRAHWNADEAGLARIGKMSAPLVAPARLVSSQDYPGQAIFEGRDGTTGVSLLIDEQGALKDCVVEQASGVATLDAQTCILFQTRGKFAAAADKDGKPIKSRLFYRFRWKTG